jgi:hypothetical protein
MIAAAANNFVTVNADDLEFVPITIPNQIMIRLPSRFKSSVSFIN